MKCKTCKAVGMCRICGKVGKMRWCGQQLVKGRWVHYHECVECAS